MNIRKNKKRVYRQFRKELLTREFHRRLARRAVNLMVEDWNKRVIGAVGKHLYIQHQELIKAFCALETAISGGTTTFGVATNGLLGNGLSAFDSHVRTTGGSE